MVTTGPYRRVRHPGYPGSAFFYVAFPWISGSVPAVAAGLLGIVRMAVRTSLEDRSLRAELAGVAPAGDRRRAVPGGRIVGGAQAGRRTRPVAALAFRDVEGPEWPVDPPPLLLTEGGLETWLVYHEGIDLPCFAAFDLVRRPGGRELLERHYRSYADVGAREGVGVILETATWRASADWGARLGYDGRQLEVLHHELVDLVVGVRAAYRPSRAPILVAGCVGPRSDAYVPTVRMTVDEAAAYHRAQLVTFAATPVDLVVASTLGYVEEALGVALAASCLTVPLVLSFTVETDGRLPSGQRVGEAIERVDAATGGRVAYYMINCAHPRHVARALEPGASWQGRLRGLRANASAQSHAELDAATELDEGDADDLAACIVALRPAWPTLHVVGGCCGTDRRHVERIARAWDRRAWRQRGPSSR